MDEKVADRVMFSEDGARIEPGDSYWEGEEHGRIALYTLEQGEKLLGLREFSAEKRKALAKKGHAMPNGGYPIENCGDVENAHRAIGRANPSERGAVRAHINSRAKALNCKVQPL